MAFSDFCQSLKEHLINVTSYLKGEKSIITFDPSIQPNLELNAIKNSASARQIISLSKAYYDQVAYKRTLNEIYKTPKQYYIEYETILKSELESLETQMIDTKEQHISVLNTLPIAKELCNTSTDLQSKLADFK